MSKLREQMCLAERGIGQIEFAEYLVDAAEEIADLMDKARNYRTAQEIGQGIAGIAGAYYDLMAALEVLDKKLNGEG